jgi:hypothetical protein
MKQRGESENEKENRAKEHQTASNKELKEHNREGKAQVVQGQVLKNHHNKHNECTTQQTPRDSTNNISTTIS